MRFLILTALLMLAPGAVALQAQVQEIDCGTASKAFMEDRAKADQFTKKHDIASAIAALKRAYSQCPQNAGNARDLASAELDAGEDAEAEQLIRSLLVREDSADLHVLLGRIASAKKDFKASAAQYQIAAKMQPTESNIFDFGTSLMKLNFGAAADVLTYGLKTFPNSVKMHVALALAFYAQGRTDEGAQLLCQAAELDPRDVHPMEVLADTQVIPASAQPEAERLLSELHKRYPRDGLILFDYAMVEAGRWSGDTSTPPSNFVSLLKDALSLDPRIPNAYFQLALLSAQAKDYTTEIVFLKKAVAIDPLNEQYHYRLAYAFRAIGDDAHFQEELATYKKLHINTGVAR